MYIKKYGLSHHDTICVGDGANDIEMIKKASFGVSFNGKKILDKEANIHFKNTNLRGLLYAQGYNDKQIIK
jgi:phosphoserine phosphatase